MTTEKPRNKAPKTGRSPFVKKLLINLCCMAAAGFALVWIALMWLDVWTDHGNEVHTPAVCGLDYATAVKTLESRGFTVELLDSVYDTTHRPGTVTDQTPKEGSMVKAGREIYLTITAFSPKMVSVPKVTDVSERQARAMLAGVGLNNITTVTVPSEYKDLVAGIRVNGKDAVPGTRVPVTARVVLEVGGGPVEERTDSVMVSTEAETTEFDF